MSVPGFQQWTPSTAKPSIYLCAHGPEKAGKTRLALTAPGPVAMLNLDRPSVGILDLYSMAKDIHVKTIVAPDETMSLDAETAKAVWAPQWDDIKSSFLSLVDAGRAGAIRTMVVDNMTRAWEACRLARLGKLTQIPPLAYAAVNDEFESMLMRPWSVEGLNVVLLHREKDVYVGKDRTGATTLDGFSGTSSVAGVNARIWRVTPVPGDDGFRMQILNSAYTGDAGQLARGSDICFEWVGRTVMPDVDPDNWI